MHGVVVAKPLDSNALVNRVDGSRAVAAFAAMKSKSRMTDVAFPGLNALVHGMKSESLGQ